ncbi:hypothetical protein BD779DRAFT_1423825, partial [Infundibulicybe gibba]
LLDSGCTHLAVNRRLVEAEKLPTVDLPTPIWAFNADGSLNADKLITKSVRFQMQIGDHKEEATALVADLGKKDLFIGHDVGTCISTHEWLHKHNPFINWKTGKI